MSNLTACERLELIRHKDRPTVNDYIPAMFTRFMEFHGDRLFGDDAAIIGGIGYLSDTPVTVIAQVKGRNSRKTSARISPCPTRRATARRSVLRSRRRSSTVR